MRRRFDLVVSVAGLDPDRARDWTIVREMVNAKDAIGERRTGELRCCANGSLAV